MILKKTPFVLVVFFIITSCATNHKITKNDRPSWLTSLSGYKSGLVATGCAGIHLKGFDAQKKLAVQRAVSSLAMQKNTKVQTISTSGEKRNKGILSSSTYTRKSQYQTNTNISFKTKEEYFDKLNKEYCVLIQEE